MEKLKKYINRPKYESGPPCNLYTLHKFNKMALDYKNIFSTTNNSPAQHELFNAAIDLLRSAVKSDNTFTSSHTDSIEISSIREMTKGNWRTYEIVPEAPNVILGTIGENSKQLIISGVGDASSKHDNSVYPRVLLIRILVESGKVEVEHPYGKNNLEMTDEEIIKSVTKELIEANARTFLFLKQNKRCIKY